jgi:uncharacterized membrane protein
VTGQKHAKDLDRQLELKEARNLLSRGLWRTTLLGAALLVNIASIVPFLVGHSLHRQFYSIGRPLLLLAMCLLTLFVTTGTRVCFIWIDVCELKKSHGKEKAD